MTWSILVVVAGLAFGADRAAAATPVLGEAGFYGEYGEGWGTAKPKLIFNGGAPSGRASKITWRSWGSATATGRGSTPIYKSSGGYYTKLGRIQLRASRLSSCPGTDGLAAYTRLTARVQQKPGGRYGRWFQWGGNADLCGSYAD